MAEQGEGQVQIEPEDPEIQLEQHVKFRRKQQVLNSGFQKLITENLSEFKQTMDGLSFAYTCLSIRNSGVKQVTEQITSYEHLRKIDLTLNILKQIPQLFELKYVTDLNISRNKISSISFLSRESVFPYLKYLNALGNKIQALPSISSKNLKTLNLNNNLINNLEEFDGHHSLQIIELRGNKLTNLVGLGNLPKLKQLYVAQNSLTDLKGLTKVPQLQKIHARKNKIVVPLLEEHVCPKYLNFRQNAVAKVDELKDVPESVEVLNLLGTPLEGELADNAKKQIWMKFRHYTKINKVQITSEEKQQFDKEYKERLAEIERQRKEEQAQRLAKEQQKQAQ